jgi:hypothetical protein
MVTAVSDEPASLSECHVTASSLPFDGSLYKLKDRERERNSTDGPLVHRQEPLGILAALLIEISLLGRDAVRTRQ